MEKRIVEHFTKSLHNHILYSLVIYCILFIFNGLENPSILKSYLFGATETEGSWEEFSSKEKRKSDEESRKSGFEGTFYPF